MRLGGSSELLGELGEPSDYASYGYSEEAESYLSEAYMMYNMSFEHV
jgi:hypothetical protein